MDKIKIKDLEVYGHHGVYPEETALGQKFLLSAVLHVSVREAGQTDDLAKSINYGEVSHFAKEFMENHTYKLLEAVVERLARAILLKWPQIIRADLELKKPWAPIGLPLDTVSVEIERGWHTAYLALGSNMGDRRAHLEHAVRALEACEDCRVLKVSDFIETEPYGVTEQDAFLNGALALRTLKTPWELLEEIHRIEAEEGRVRTLRWGPRTLDLDILLYDGLVLDSEDLHIPHIEMHKRDFVLAPLAQIAPYLRHPILHKTVEELRGERNG